ncbi:GCN5-related N-acetyltransferase [Halorubrum californiense DSM 19288]|uniref:GCN5-related N-acetyltransferase n=1 Tax=Halorubrum californiense DSM 19288 TaxID=1227465 RepID=M0E2E0_9EURY|nr:MULTISPECIES: GNAT family N-acetyltransferase [Halorubrum]ELZ41960.1 GCN5-related N-acetyltransferase [Halorubrum californiense DSM 19288]TKX67459.1 GNAT family N-acetyltransferase [Halorubrum sp. GN11GM_10-3_MGM]
MSVEIRPYDRDRDADGLYALKTAFERGLGEHTGGDEKAAAYEGKLTDAYRDRWLDWVDRCVDDDPRCVTVAVEEGEERPMTADAVVGYVFVLPERMAMVWDAAVLNEIYVTPEHRGTGLADDLIDAALSLAADQSLPLDRLVLDVDPANERAKQFYDRHGFESWGEMVARPLAER